MDRIVEVALNSLTKRVRNKGVAGTRERDATIVLFKTLKKHNHPLNPDEIAGWLVTQLGWEPRHAADVKQIAIKIDSGKKLRTRSPESWNKNIYKIWKEKAESDVNI